MLKNKFIIGYAGGMGEANALDYLIAAAKLIKDQAIAIVLVSDGPNKASMQQRVANENLNNVHFYAIYLSIN